MMIDNIIQIIPGNKVTLKHPTGKSISLEIIAPTENGALVEVIKTKVKEGVWSKIGQIAELYIYKGIPIWRECNLSN